MAISIVINKENKGLKKKATKGARQTVETSLVYQSYKNAGEQFMVTGDTCILVGLTEGKSEPKAKVVTYNNNKEPEVPKELSTLLENPHEIYFYREDGKTKISIPKNVKNVAAFVGGVRIYTENGLVKTIRGKEPDEKICVFRHGDTLFIRLGKTMNELVKEQKKKEEAKMGVWRA